MPTYADYDIILTTEQTTGEVYELCPKCSAHRKPEHQHLRCLGIDLDRGIFHCNHPDCDASGSLKHGWRGEAAQAQVSQRTWTTPVFHPETLSARTIQWFARRKIPADILVRRQISATRAFMSQVGAVVDVIQFPYFRQGKIVNIQYRDAKKHFRLITGAERIFYGLDDIQGDTVWITEGQMDALSLETIGIPSVLSVPDGAPAINAKNFDKKFEFLRSAKPSLDSMKRIMLAVDTDAPGQRLAEELARLLGPDRCYRVQWGAHCKDANEVLVTEGAEALKACCASATPWPVQGSIRIGNLRPQIEQLYSNGIAPGIHPGWETLQPYYTIRPGHLTVVTGAPAMGKSQWLSALMINLALREGWRFLVFSPENYPPAEYATLLMEQYLGAPFFDRGSGRMTHPESWEAQAWLDEHIILLDAEDQEPTIEWVLRMAKLHVERDGIRGLIIDPWNEIDHHIPVRTTETQYIGSTLSRIRHFGAAHGLHVWIGAHPFKLQKAQKGKYEGQYPPAAMYDISSSAHWFNKPDVGISVWRDLQTNAPETEIHILKARRKYDGKPGVVTLHYDRRSGRYYDPGTEPVPSYSYARPTHQRGDA